MPDTTLSQAVNRLDRLEQIVLDQTQGLDTVILAIDSLTQNLANIPALEERQRRRHQQHDLELDDLDERTERLERNHLEHGARLEKLEDIQADMKVMLEILVSRSTGESTD